MTPARIAAVRALLSLEQHQTTLAAEIERGRRTLSDPRDLGLFLELASGVLRWRAALDARLRPFLRRPLDELAPELLAILRLAIYQIDRLDRVPDHAVVHESVELTRALGQPRASGFVNGVLRNLLRSPQRTSAPGRPANLNDREAALDYLSITLSHPRWLVARWLDRVGFEATERWCRLNNTPPEVTVRPVGMTTAELLTRLKSEGIEAVAGAFVSDAIRIPAGGLTRLQAPLRQSMMIQDEASQLVAIAAGATPGERVLDVCAAPGGKTVMLAEGVGPTGHIIASDRRPRRVALLQKTLAQAGVFAPLVVIDALAGLPFGPVFDRVLLDAPCSGLGTLRRDPDIKWTRAEADLDRFATAQRTMLNHAAAVVRPGGSLIYATCSSEPDENERVVDAFLAITPDFAPAPLVPRPSLPHATSLFDDRGWLQTRPFEHGLDAFFAARLVRREAT